jgi:glycosyltransferase involved in cell wall biosynthesis
MKISFIRGAYLNNFEGQNYDLPMKGYSSLFPLDSHVPFEVTKLFSLADLQRIPPFSKPIKYIANRTLGDAQILFGLERQIWGADIVHVADPHYYYSYQAAKLREKGKIKKLVCTWWETIPFNNEGTTAKKNIKKYTMRQVDQYICYTKKAKECVLAEGVNESKIVVIPLGVDLQKFRPAVHSNKKCTILFVGRLEKEKGILDVYEAFKQLTKSEKNSLLRIVGRGPLEGKLRKMTKNDGLENYITIEQKAYSEMPMVYAQADTLCVPSKKTQTWEEQLGMVFIEAMASGLPIVSYSTGAIPEVVGEAGILLKDGDIEGLGQSFKRLTEDTQMRVKLGTMGRERAEKMFDCEKTRERIYKLYKEMHQGVFEN